MKFNCFPKKQRFFLVYSSYLVFRSQFFSDLILQSSPKNSIFYRFLKSSFGFCASSFWKFHIEVPTKESNYVGIIKDAAIILFEMKNEKPVYVWRKNNKKEWEKEKFIGYQLLSEYSLKEFDQKYETIEKALQLHWNYLDNEDSQVHGDLTHFNILVDDFKNIFFIDQKPHPNSRLFDFYYFYAYLIQCISSCNTLENKSRIMITANIESILKKVCLYNSKQDLLKDYESIVIPDQCGIQNQNKKKYLNDFLKIFSE